MFDFRLIFFAGTGVFAGYLGRNDLTEQVLCNINNEICYRTGDLGRLNPKTHSFEYCGRRDYQVKIRGQRIELGEIESIIMEIATMCIVIKITHLNNEYLVGYVETKSSQDELHQHCSSRLPLYMVPSFFVVLEKLPLNQNGKIDRKALPKVDFDLLFVCSNETNQPLTEMEKKVFGIWCQVLHHLK
jgi:acyl-CoA synthetase (AMP-forming)/AMP-acid ligase II